MRANTRFIPPMATSKDDEWLRNWADGTAKAVQQLATWMYRRREMIAFSSPITVTRRVEVEFDVPTALAQASTNFESPWVLIGFLPAAGTSPPLVTDESAARTTVLTGVEADRLAVGALARLIARGVGEDYVATAETRIAAGPQARAALLEAPLETLTDLDRNLATRIRDDVLIRTLVEAMQDTYPLFAQVEPRDRRRRAFTYEYDDTVRRTHSPLLGRNETRTMIPWLVLARAVDRMLASRLFQRLGWTETRTTIRVPGLLLTSVYEVAIEVPDGVVVSDVSVTSANPGSSDAAIPETGRYARVDVPDAKPTWRGSIQVNQRAEPAYPFAVLLTAATVALVLTGGLLRLTSLAGAPEASGAILLAIPALFTTLVAQPGRGTPAARLLTGARVVLVLTGVLAYVAAVMLVLYPRDTGVARVSRALDLFWLVDMIVAWSLVGLLAFALGPQLRQRFKRARSTQIANGPGSPWPSSDGLMGAR